MGTEIRNAVIAADQNARYDKEAKRLLGSRIILAHILAKAVDEFREMDPEKIQAYIEGDPFIGTVSAEPGRTNAGKKKRGQRTVGLNTEDTEVGEGAIWFDIIFYVRMKDGISQIIVNLEIQKDEPAGYHILNRAVFYASRMISSQKERDFVHMDYNEIKRVFSIWLCVSMPENSMGYFHLTKDDLLGSYQWKGRLDLLNIIMIGITDELPEQKEGYELHRLLSVLLSMELSVAEKLEIMEREYHIPINGEMKEGLNAMCNLSQGIMEKGIKRGMEKGIEKGIEKGGALGEKRSSELAVRLVEAGRIDDLIRAAADEGHRHKLFAEFGIS